MVKIQDGLFIGNEDDCRVGDEEWAVVHACKSPCHQRAVGYHGNLSPDHPHYLVLEEGTNLYLNIIDPQKPLFMPPTFTSYLAFMRNLTAVDRKILVHCNQGESRAPSLALLFLAKVTRTISNESYYAARSEFERLFSGYYPGQGIQLYLSEHWNEIDDF